MICALPLVVLIGVSIQAASPSGAGTTAEPPQPDGEHTETTDEARRVAFRWNWPADPVRYQLERRTVDTIPVPGKDPVVTQVLSRTVSHERVGEGTAGEDLVRVRWDAIALDRRDSLARPVEYDSREDGHAERASDPAIAQSVMTLGQSITYDMDPIGRVRGVRGLEEFLRGIEINLTRWGLARDRTYERLQLVFTPEVIAGAAAGTYAFLPDRPLAIGDSYGVTRSITFEHVHTLETVETHTLESVETDTEGHEIARFAVTGTLRWPDPGGLASEVFNVSLDKASVEGAWAFDLTRGLVTESTLTCSFLSDIVRYNPQDRMSTEGSTEQSLTDRMVLLGESESGPVPTTPPDP